MKELKEFIKVLKIAHKEEMTADSLKDNLSELNDNEISLFSDVYTLAQFETNTKYKNFATRHLKLHQVIEKHNTILKLYRSNKELLYESKIKRYLRTELIKAENKMFRQYSKHYNVNRKIFVHKQHYKNVVLLFDICTDLTIVECIKLYLVMTKQYNVDVALISSSITRFHKF